MVSITNRTAELSDCRNAWVFNEQFGCWCLTDILYTQKARTPEFQRLNIYVPAAYMTAPGVVNPGGSAGNFTAVTAPVVFENNSAGYRQMPSTPLGDHRDESGKYLARGMVYVSCGCRGRDSVDSEGKLCGKAPATLVDLKTAIRFLRHNAAVLPGDFGKMISVGWSAGGAMSALVGVTGDDVCYADALRENGAFMDESDSVLAAQIYCPITDLEHADLAYEWQFCRDAENEDTPSAPAGTMTPFQKALSEKLTAAFVAYFNGLGLTDPATGAALTLSAEGRGGSGYDWLMARLEEAAAKYLSRLPERKTEDAFTAEDYLLGNYTQAVHTVRRGPNGPVHETVERQGADKRGWLDWDGRRASITCLDDYILHHRRRMKPCTSFDALDLNSPENQELGTPEQDRMHFNAEIASAISALKEAFPAEYEAYYNAYAAVAGDEALEQRKRLLNPLRFVGGGAQYYRIRVGADDADTAFFVSAILYLKLKAAGKDADYALVWEQPHSEADYPGEVCDWIEKLCV